MADVTRDRGQLILVTGLLIAVAMVALVLLLNTAIYTENLASRGSDQSGREAIEYRTTVVDGVGGLIEEENEAEHGTYSAVETNVTSGVETMDDLTARNYALGGTLVRINQSTVTTREGTLVRQTTDRQFLNESGALTDWRLASGVDDDEVRSFRMNVSQSSLEPDVTDAVNVRVEDTSSGDTWQAFVYASGGNVTVATSIDGGVTTTDVCTVAASRATVDLTRGTLDGEPCQGLNWAEAIGGSYEVAYRNGENATGTYNVTFDDVGATVDATNVDASPPGTVYRVPAVYSVSFEVTYESPTLTYRRGVRVAPGEAE